MCLASSGCLGELDGPVGPVGTGQYSEQAEPESASSACEARWPKRLVLLNDFQHVSSLRALLGSELIAGEDAPRRELKPFAQKGLVVNTSLVHTRMGWAEE